MIKRRIWETVADKCLKPSINMARPARACKATSAIWLSGKVGGEAGGLHRPRPSDGGGRFPPEGGGSGRNPLPGKYRRRGRTSRRHPPSLKFPGPLSLRHGHCDEARRAAALHAHQNAVLVVVA